MLSNPIFKFLASLKLAVLCLLSLAGVLAAATIFESIYGTRAAHVLVYGTPWFYALLALLATNVLCAALSRWPWKKRHIGFVVTHAGIITILLGSFLTMRFGVDGSLPVYEGSEDNDVILNKLKLSIMDEDGKVAEHFPVPESAVLKRGTLMEVALPESRNLIVDEFVPRAVPEEQIQPSPLPGVGQPAVRVEVFNGRFRVDQWLMTSQPEKPTQVSLGPAVLSLQKLWSIGEQTKFLDKRTEPPPKIDPIGYLAVQFQGRQLRVPVGSALHHWQKIEGTPYSIRIDRYLPYAVVEDNDLVSRSEEPVNPAVQLTLRDAAGVSEKHSVFSNFPEFSTRHKTIRPQEPFPVKLSLVSTVGQAQNRMNNARGRLRFAQSADNRHLYYQVRGSTGEVNREGEVKLGEEVSTGWMDLKFKVTNWVPAAISQEVPHYVEYIQGNGDNFMTAMRIRQVSARAPSSADVGGDADWLMEGSQKSLSVGNRTLVVRYGKERLALPFRLFLDKFTIGNDPGTAKAASYQSQVTLKDPDHGVERKALISMNEPLQYGGYTFYQASYQLNDNAPPISVFSVNYDPGRVVKYIGSIVMILGILFMFYFNPQYWDAVLGKKRKAVHS